MDSRETAVPTRVDRTRNFPGGQSQRAAHPNDRSAQLNNGPIDELLPFSQTGSQARIARRSLRLVAG